MNKSILVILLAPILFSCSKEPDRDLLSGLWRFELQLQNDSINLPFFMEIMPVKGSYSAAIYNGDESIVHDDVRVMGDSLFIESPYFQSEFRLKRMNNELHGYWQDHSRGDSYRIPCTAKYNLNQRFSFNALPNDSIDGNWEVWFGAGESSYPAIGSFVTGQNSTTGTFITETGDYRFLEGGFGGGRLKLSAFDGSHAFLFVADLISDTLHGIFYSGSHYRDSFIAWRNNSFSLSDPYQRTQVIESKPLKFKAMDRDGKEIEFDGSVISKPYLIQIMGSWCPNCMDECAFLSSKFSDLQEKGVEVMAITFERMAAEKAFTAIDRMKENLGVPYPIYYGGSASKKDASAFFPTLSSIEAYPTLLFIDKNGRIQKVHSGFYGPGTGNHFKEQTAQFDRDIEELITRQ